MHWLFVVDLAHNERTCSQGWYPLLHTGLDGSFHSIDPLLCGDLLMEDLSWHTTAASPTNSLDNYLLWVIGKFQGKLGRHATDLATSQPEVRL